MATAQRRLVGPVNKWRSPNLYWLRLSRWQNRMSGKVVKGNAIAVKPEDSTEVWRLLGSLELLSVNEKIELANLDR